MSLRSARHKAQALWNKGSSNVRSGTLAEAFALWEEDLRVRKPDSCENTITVRKAQLNKHISSYWDRELSSVDGPELRRLHIGLGKQSHHVANDVLRHMRTMWKFATDDPWPGGNIDMFRTSKSSSRRQIEDPSAFWAEIREKCPNPAVQAFWKIAALTGLRKNDILTARHEHLKDGWLHVPRPKGGPDRAFDIPLADQVLDCVASLPEQGPWLLPGYRYGQHLVNPKPSSIRHLPGPHQCRHLWRVVAENVCGAPFPVVRSLMNHSESRGATDLYGSNYDDPEVLKDWAQKITDELWLRYGFATGNSLFPRSEL